MKGVFAALAVLASAVLLAACGMKEGRLSSVDYQPEPNSRVPGYNLYSYESLDNRVSQRVNQYSRSMYIHEQQHNYIQRLSERQKLDKDAQKLGREPGSLFRQ